MGKAYPLNKRRLLGGALLFFLMTGGLGAQDLPLSGLAHVGIAVSNLDAAKQFYTGVLGIDMAFDLIRPDGKTLWLQYYKINEEQYLEIYPTLKPDSITRETHIAFVTPDIEKLHQMIEERGIKVTPLNPKPGADGNRNFSIRPPPGQELVFLEFVQYMPASLHLNASGKALSSRRISTHMVGAGVLVSDAATAEGLYKTLGFTEVWRSSAQNGKATLVDMRLPGPSGDYVELVERSMPVTAQEAGEAGHVVLEVANVRAAYKAAKERGAKILGPPALNAHKTLSFAVLDPDGTLFSFEQGKMH
jgi:catechol 2,3-dioxygenase-like lactoylglutathione lyase family enzyme